MEKRLFVQEFSVESQQTTIEGKAFPPSIVVVSFKTLTGNQPSTYGNSLALWPDSFIPWGTPPQTQSTIPKNTPVGSHTFDNLDLQGVPYVVAYTTGKSPNTACSTVTFTPGVTDGEVFNSSIAVVSISTDSVIARFATPIGNDPKANRNWIGLWKGRVVTWDGRNRLTKVEVSKTTDSGIQAIPYPLNANETYTLGYATGPDNTDICATATFTVTQLRFH